ncbi:helix-turn-helix transcriptional regulator [Roseibium sp.]|uniref:helix-turn-helix transcriptional regulator n=1 Tax=Roseibium sp. TaxID=1936156 RepID=UPI003A96AB1F
MIGSIGQIDYRVIEKIHECAGAPHEWPEAIAALSVALSCRIYVLEFEAGSHHTGRYCHPENVTHILEGLSQLDAEGGDALQFLLEHAALYYPYWKSSVEPSGPVVPGSAEEDQGDWVRMSALITPIVRTPEKVILVAGFWEPDIARDLGLDDVLPNFRRYVRAMNTALSLGDRLTKVESRFDSLQAMLKMQKHAAFLVDDQLSVLFCTPATQSLLEQGTLFTLEDGQLIPLRPELYHAITSIKRFLAGAQKPLSRQLLMAAVTEPNKSIFLQEQNNSYCHIRLQSIVPETAASDGSAGSILIEVRESSAIAPQVREFLQSKYGLSQSEARLAHNLSVTGSLATTLEGLDITRNTAKTHLRRIYEKTETQSQLELARLLHRLSGLF